MTTVEKVMLLKGVDLFAQVAADELAAIARIAKEIRLDAGEAVMREGEHGDALFFVVSGAARVHRAGRDVAEVGAHGVIGELALLDPGPRAASVDAIGELVLLQIGRDDFVEIMAAHPEVPVAVITMLARRVRDSLGQR